MALSKPLCSLARSFFRSLSPAPLSNGVSWHSCMCNVRVHAWHRLLCNDMQKSGEVLCQSGTGIQSWLDLWDILAFLDSCRVNLPAFPHLVHQSTPPSLLWKLTSKLWPSYSWYTPLKHFSTCEGCWVPRVEDLLNLPTTSVFRRHLAYYPAITQPSPLPSFSLFPVLFLFVGWLTSWRTRLENMLNPP